MSTNQDKAEIPTEAANTTMAAPTTQANAEVGVKPDESEEGQPETPATPSKVDPETLALRADPPRAIKFKKSAVISIGAVVCAIVAGSAWFALGGGKLPFVGQTQDRSTQAKVSTEALNALPASYDQVPQLGPPLPGDLGRPILEHQRTMASGPLAAGSNVDETVQQHSAAQMQRDQEAAERKAARQSGLLVRTGTPLASASLATVQGDSAESGAPSTRVAGLALDPTNDPNAQGRKADFVAASDHGDDRNPYSLVPAASPNTLVAGSVIAASLITGLRSDLPGLVIAQVTERVFDSATGSILLIPQGARLIGSYDSVVAFGQKRALIVWQRIIMPDGSSIRLDNVPASDASGYAGLADKVDFHTWTLLKGVAISTMLGVGANLTFSGESDLVQAIRESTQMNVSRAGDQITSRNLQIQPTITIRPGAPVRLVVHRDLVFPTRN